MRTIVYVDAFSFYMGLTKGTPYKWCNLNALSQDLMPASSIAAIKVFTAHSKALVDDPDVPKRQDVYFRALRTIPNLEIHTGKFAKRVRWLPLEEELRTGVLKHVQVRDYQEKGSDVKLASHLLRDAFLDRFDLAAVFTNDSDLASPILMAREDAGKRVEVFLTFQPGNPERHGSKELMRVASRHHLVSIDALARSQFPRTIIDSRGRPITRPVAWDPG